MNIQEITREMMIEMMTEMRLRSRHRLFPTFRAISHLYLKDNVSLMYHVCILLQITWLLLLHMACLIQHRQHVLSILPLLINIIIINRL